MPNDQRIVWIGLAIVAIAILALVYFLFLAPAGEKHEVTVPETVSRSRPQEQAAGAPSEEPDPAIIPLDLDLDQSDAAVRELVAAGEIPPAMKAWLVHKDIVRTVVSVVDGIARGESPAAQLPFLAPADRFPVMEKNGRLTMDPRGFQRYDKLVGVFTAVPDRTWIAWYRTLRPTLEKAFNELGYPGVTFAQRIRQALEHLTQAPLLNKEAVLERKVMSYAFAEIGLEELSPAQKHMLRLGPVNAGRIQNKLRALAAALKLSEKN